jgi:hypothetical protein
MMQLKMEEKEIAHAKAQRRKEEIALDASLRLCAFA